MQSAAPAHRDASDDARARRRRRRVRRARRASGARTRGRPGQAVACRCCQPGAPDRVLLCRVRCARFAAHLLGRARHTGRRYPEGSLRPGAADGRGRSAVSHGLFPPAHRRIGSAARILARCRPRTAAVREGHRRRCWPVTVEVPILDENVIAQVWRVDVGRVPLYLLDTDLPANSAVGRWVTSRLYESNRTIRLAQYAVLGVGGVRALRALGIDPAVYHVNEGHAALGVFELLAQARAAGESARRRVAAGARAGGVHDPHPGAGRQRDLPARGDTAGARAYRRPGRRPRAVPRRRPHRPGKRRAAFGHVGARPAGEPSGQRCQQAPRRGGPAMWQPLFPGRALEEVPITHVTNGVHVPTWLRGPMRELLDRYLGEGWLGRADRSGDLGAGERHPRQRTVGGTLRGTRAAGRHDRAAKHGAIA